MSVQRAVKQIQKLYPIAYSETAWDNTGLLLDSTHIERPANKPLRILLTIDLTQNVVQEAVNKDIELIVAYHPFLFRKFNKIEPSVIPQHRSLIKLLQNGISVYSPHTAVDAVRHGVNDWLVEGLSDNSNLKEVSVISPNAQNADVGCGRLIELSEGVKLDALITRLKSHLGVNNLLVASTEKSLDKVLIKTIALCAGSGGSVFNDIKDQSKVDLFITGELSHHEGLALKENGKVVLLANHSNTERGYLSTMERLLRKEISDAEFFVSEEDEDTYDFV